ncbi:MAG: WYL domain-containing protein [Lachnospiraceae bacterium]|nr:WYL domain-containing protein [Lachnospiraceae bacterium]
MAYSEVIKDFNRIRSYIREFYVYGFKTREEYNQKSSRSYDNERRRLESWLGDHIQFRQTADGKNVFLSIDSRKSRYNPLYKTWKTKSFTDGDITLHFILMDILSMAEEPLGIGDITTLVDEYLYEFNEPRSFDESTVRKKIKEYVNEGIIVAEKKGKTLYYSIGDMKSFDDNNVLDFFSEIAPCGVIGSFILDKKEKHESIFAFKHHYITGAMDSDILCSLFIAMEEKREVILELKNNKPLVVPLRIMLSVQSGRQYVMVYIPKFKRVTSYRLDGIKSVKAGNVNEEYDKWNDVLDGMLSHMWGVSTQGCSNERIEHIEFNVHYEDDEQYIHNRLEREKRCGTVEKTDNNTSRFYADVYDSCELLTWIRTFICRITDFHCTNDFVEKRFYYDLYSMYNMYDIEDGGQE